MHINIKEENETQKEPMDAFLEKLIFYLEKMGEIFLIVHST